MNTHSDTGGPSLLGFILEHNERANAEGIAFVRWLRGVNPFWRDTCDHLLGNHHWMAPSVTAGFWFAERDLPVLLQEALDAMLALDPTHDHTAVEGFVMMYFPVFQDKVSLIVRAMHMYSSDIPTQARIVHGLVELFQNPAVKRNLTRCMEDLVYTMPLVRAVLKNLYLYRREYQVAMLCIELLELLCDDQNVWLEIGIECGALKVLLSIMNTDDQPASYAPLRIACGEVLMELCQDHRVMTEYVYVHGGVPILHRLMTRDLGFTESEAVERCAIFRAPRP